MKFLTLMYHAVLESKEALSKLPPEDRPYAITRVAFERDLNLIRSRGYVFLEPENLESEKSDCSVLLTFDDALACHSEVALPVLCAQNLKALFFLDTARLDKDDGISLTRDGAKKLQDAGQTLGSHSDHHVFLDSLNQKMLEKELQTSRDKLSEITGAEPDYLSFPGGRFNEGVIDTAERLGFKKLYSSLNGINSVEDNFIYRYARRRGKPEALLGVLERRFFRLAFEKFRSYVSKKRKK